MGFLSNLDPVQLALVAVGLFIAIPAVIPFISNVFSGMFTKSDREKDIIDLVGTWRDLSVALHEAGLHKACDQLDEIFPMLIEAKKKSDNHKKESTDG